MQNFLVHEAYTSSVCPRCRRHGLTKPRHILREDGATAPIHHLLRCGNKDCSCHWWHRDILATGKHALRTGSWDPIFSRAASIAAEAA